MLSNIEMHLGEFKALWLRTTSGKRSGQECLSSHYSARSPLIIAARLASLFNLDSLQCHTRFQFTLCLYISLLMHLYPLALDILFAILRALCVQYIIHGNVPTYFSWGVSTNREGYFKIKKKLNKENKVTVLFSRVKYWLYGYLKALDVCCSYPCTVLGRLHLLLL